MSLLAHKTPTGAHLHITSDTRTIPELENTAAIPTTVFNSSSSVVTATATPFTAVSSGHYDVIVATVDNGDMTLPMNSYVHLHSSGLVIHTGDTATRWDMAAAASTSGYPMLTTAIGGEYNAFYGDTS